MRRSVRRRPPPLFLHGGRRGHHDETDTESSSFSSEEEEEEEEEEGEGEGGDDDDLAAAGETGDPKLQQQQQQQQERFLRSVRKDTTISISSSSSPSSSVHASREKKSKSGGDGKGTSRVAITLKKICKVCKGTGHQAGFQGAIYIDCPKKPCFLCKLPGHTTMSCPHRVSMEHGVAPSPRRHNMQTSFDHVFQRQLRANQIPKIKPPFIIPNRVVGGVVKFHSRRVTCLEFHPSKDGILLSGDKKGQIGIWDYEKLHEKTIYGSIHSCILNNMKFNPHDDGTLFTSSSDGTVCCLDLETGMPSLLMDLNSNGWTGWRMFYGLDVNRERGILLVADNSGSLHLVDTRSSKQIGKSILIHKRGTKVVGLHCNPVQPDILLSCGNDHYARIWDVRRIEDGSSLGELAHGRVVNSAYFSPSTGSKILSTSQDNRIRVWDSIFHDLQSPSREIIHSHDFNRHLTCFRAEWDPKDPSESLAVVGRYISENINGIALHPIDFVDTSTGQLVAEVTEPEIPTISPVCKLHPRENILASGSSRSVFIWRPEMETESESLQERCKRLFVGRSGKKSSGNKFYDENGDGDDGFFAPSKKKKMKATKKLSN